MSKGSDKKPVTTKEETQTNSDREVLEEAKPQDTGESLKAADQADIQD